MTGSAPTDDLGAMLADVVRTAISEIRPRLIEAAFTGEPEEAENLRHTDNFLSAHDMWMHERYRTLLTPLLGSFVYASEEAEPQIIGPDPEPDLCVLVDPLDTSELAVRGLHGYTHTMIYSRSVAQPVAAVIGDIYHHIQLYIAARDADGHDHAYALTADGHRYPLTVHKPKRLSEALVTNYLMRPGERFLPLAGQTRLLEALDQPGPDGKQRGRIGVDFGSVSLCHVAAGFTDAVIEFAKGFAIWDLAPGHYVLHAAGGTVIDLDGDPLPLDYGMRTIDGIGHAMHPRQHFIAAGSQELAHEILAALSA